VMQNHTHIVPVFVGDPERCKRASDLLLERHPIYIQSINYPTVAKRTERLRITPSPHHDNTLINELAEALIDVWAELGLSLNRPALAAESRSDDGRMAEDDRAFRAWVDPRSQAFTGAGAENER